MAGVEIILAPFHAGERACRVGKGPQRLLDAGLAEALESAGAGVSVTELGPLDALEGEIGRSFELMRQASRAVAAARRAGRFPLVLAGNCNVTVGAFSGLHGAQPTMLWFDAHPDFDTPDEHRSGYFDGMGVATLMGQCWHRLAATIEGFRPLGSDRLVYCGIRDFEPGQREKVEASGLRAVFGSVECKPQFQEELRRELHGTAGTSFIHLDLDCLDTSIGHANEYAAPGGLDEADLLGCLRDASEQLPPAAMTIASFNPDLEGGDAIADIGVRAAREVVASLERSRHRG